MGVKFIYMHREYRIFSSLRSRRLEVEGARKNVRVRVSLSRARSFLRPLLPSACYAGYIFSEMSLPAPGIRHMKPVQKRGLIHLARRISDIHQLLWKGPCSID